MARHDADENGGWDPYDLSDLETSIYEDILSVLAFVHAGKYLGDLGFERDELSLKYSWAVGLLLAFLFVHTGACQSTDATVSGLVADASGHAITSADVEILNVATGVRYPGKTNEA